MIDHPSICNENINFNNETKSIWINPKIEHKKIVNILSDFAKNTKEPTDFMKKFLANNFESLSISDQIYWINKSEECFFHTCKSYIALDMAIDKFPNFLKYEQFRIASEQYIKKYLQHNPERKADIILYMLKNEIHVEVTLEELNKIMLEKASR